MLLESRCLDNRGSTVAAHTFYHQINFHCTPHVIVGVVKSENSSTTHGISFSGNSLNKKMYEANKHCKHCLRVGGFNSNLCYGHLCGWLNYNYYRTVVKIHPPFSARSLGLLGTERLIANGEFSLEYTPTRDLKSRLTLGSMTILY